MNNRIRIQSSAIAILVSELLLEVPVLSGVGSRYSLSAARRPGRAPRFLRARAAPCEEVSRQRSVHCTRIDCVAAATELFVHAAGGRSGRGGRGAESGQESWRGAARDSQPLCGRGQLTEGGWIQALLRRESKEKKCTQARPFKLRLGGSGTLLHE
eukprot:101014-Pleurochrysis_carterae.AAC.2